MEGVIFRVRMQSIRGAGADRPSCRVRETIGSVDIVERGAATVVLAGTGRTTPARQADANGVTGKRN